MTSIAEVSYKKAFLEYLNYHLARPRENFLISLEDFQKISVLDVSSYIKSNAYKIRPNFLLPKDIIIIGAGGVTSWFLSVFLKMLYSKYVAVRDSITSNPEINIYIYDYDVVEQKNTLRQNFIQEDVGRNKAEVLAERYNVYENINVYAVPKYFYSFAFTERFLSEEDKKKFYMPGPGITGINTEMFTEFPRSINPTMIINCVDNELTKHMIDYVMASSLSGQTYYFSAGCYEHGGTVTSLLPPFDFFSLYFQDETFLVEDAEIHTESCAEIAERATVEQTFQSNYNAALALCNIIENTLYTPGYNVERISFVSTGRPYYPIVKDNPRNLYRVFTNLLQKDFLEFTNYIEQRDGEFKKSAAGKRYKEFYLKWKDYIDFNKHLDVTIKED